MVFSSPFFLLVFLPATILIFHIIPNKWLMVRNIFLLLVSLCFFAWGSPQYITLLLVSILLNFFIGLFINRYADIKLYKKSFVIAGVILNLSLLFYYKYSAFFVVNTNRVLGTSFPIPSILLPIGISFFTFQGMSYILDAYWDKIETNKSIIDFALYIALFPQLIAGPIVNYKDISSQLHNHPVTAEMFVDGIERFIIGLSKKILIADIIGNQAANIFEAAQYGIDTPSAWLGVICYTFQIYFDFSAYSDMAIGLAKMFGFSLLENFNYPYISTSITDFWRRWHISLSTWFRDYLYIPLGGNRRGNIYINLLIVFCATGLWHGAHWQFLLWGLWHGAFLIIEKIMLKNNMLDRIPIIIRWITTIFIVVIGWALFSANGLRNALEMYKILFGLKSADFIALSFEYYLNNQIIFTLLLAIIGSTPVVSRLLYKNKENLGITITRRCVELGLLVLCIINSVSGIYSPFIYFRF